MSLLRRAQPPSSDAPAGATRGTGVRVAGGSAGQGAGQGAGKATGKGRPTPKRREAQGRRGPVGAPPRTQREASKLARENRPDKAQRRELRAKEAERRRAGLARGDDKYLPARDRGPVRAFVRDLVDSRPHLLGLFMPLALIVVASALLPVPAWQQYMSLFSLVMLMVMIAEGVYLGLTITSRVRGRFPDEQVGALGIGWYSFTRATQPRKLRMPKPRVERGANP